MAQKISKKLSFIGSNIKKIRKVKHISQADFATSFNLARPSVGAYEEGRSEPKIETIIAIASHFRISIDVLLTRDLTVSEIFSIDQLNRKLDSVHVPGDDQVEIGPSTSKTAVPLIEVSNSLDYIVGHQNADFFSKLKHVEVPVQFSGSIRVFEMNGSEMEYHQQGLHHGDLLVCKQQSLEELKKHIDEVFVVVHKSRVFTRRLSGIKKGVLYFLADDPHYEDDLIDPKDVLQYWHVKMGMSQYLARPSLLEERVLRLEKKFDELSSDH